MNKHRRGQHKSTPPPPAPKNRVPKRTHELSGDEDEDFDSTGDNFCTIEPLSIFRHTRLYKAIHKRHRHITLWDEYNGSPENCH